MLVALCSVSIVAARSAAIDRLYVFGDSYSDIGEGYLDGNGPTAVAYLAESLGFHLVPANATQTAGQSLDFAISGAGTGVGKGSRVETALLGVGMQNQVDDFAARVRSGTLTFDGGKTLFFLAGGLNDKKLTSEQTVTNLEREVLELYKLGARRFLVALLPTAIPAFSAVGERLNPDLARIPDELATQTPGAKVYLSRWGAYFDTAMRHPEQYGLTNTMDACAGRAIFHQADTACANPETYFYYHAGHPSTAVHRVVGGMLYREVVDLFGK